MSASDEDRHGIGGNFPPAPLTPLEIVGYLIDTERDLLDRRDELLAGAARFATECSVINDEDEQGQAGDFAKQISAAMKQAKDAFTIAKRPFLEGGRAIDQFFKGIVDPLQHSLDAVRRPMTIYALKVEAEERARRAEAARQARVEALRAQQALADEEARQAAAAAAQRPASALPPPTIDEAIAAASMADAADKAARAKSADLTRNRGDLGSVSSLRELWDVELIDLTLVPIEFLEFNWAAARRAVSGGKRQEIPGCRVFVTKHVMTR